MDEYIEKIQKHPLFLRLKDVVENNAWHDHEDVFTHSVKTKDIALREINSDFITNTEAKEKFLRFINEYINGFKRADLLILIALLHDIGKILSIKKGESLRSIEVTDDKGITSPPGHEYWGSTIVHGILKDLSLDDEVAAYITKGIKVHDAFQGEYFPSKKDWPKEKLINDIKSRAEGLYIESMFNNMCDVYTATPFQPYKELVFKIFNEPDFYERQEYVIAGV